MMISSPLCIDVDAKIIYWLHLNIVFVCYNGLLSILIHKTLFKYAITLLTLCVSILSTHCIAFKRPFAANFVNS